MANKGSINGTRHPYMRKDKQVCFWRDQPHKESSPDFAISGVQIRYNMQPYERSHAEFMQTKFRWIKKQK